MRKIGGFIVFLTLISFIFSACGLLGGRGSTGNMQRDYLDSLDVELQRVPSYDKAFHHRIDSVKAALCAEKSNMQHRWELQTELGLLYRSFCADSSSMFHRNACITAQQMGHDSLLWESKLNLVYAYAASGLFLPAKRLMETLDTANISPEQKLDYYAVNRRMYSNITQYAHGNSDVTEFAQNANDNAEHYIIANMPEDIPMRHFILAQHLHRHGEDRQARQLVDGVLRVLPVKDNLYGMAAYLRADIARAAGDDDGYGRYLAMSAISDIRGSVKETMSMMTLAQWLYNRGDVERAYRYINASLHDAIAANARMRTVEIASLLPVIDDTFKQKLARSRDAMEAYFWFTSALLIVTCFLLVMMFRSKRRIGAARAKLQAQSKTQETYIGHILGLCSSYSGRLESLRGMVERKLSVGKAEELQKMMKSPRFADSENDEFFKVFDEAFLDIYPDFIEHLNALLRPDACFELHEGAPLTTELRIYAFLRLGLTDTAKIAQILHCSTNTVYTYRNRMRNRAIKRDTFDADVMLIDSAQP